MLRLSDYTIFVAVPDKSKYILAHGYTGSIDLVDERIVDCIRTPSDDSCLLALPAHVSTYLEQRGYLTQKTSLEEEEQIRTVAEVSHRCHAFIPPKIYLMPTYECNLRCTYCFEHPIRRVGRREGWAGSVITRQYAKAAFRAMNRLYEGQSVKAVTLYGGEALMPDNRECIEYILQHARKENYAVMAATHGRDLDQYLDIIGPDGIAALHVPVDGPQETHDKLRFGINRSPTFSRIIRNLHLSLERGARIRLRVNVNREVLNRLEEFADFLEEEGFTNTPLFSCYLKAIFPVTSVPPEQLRTSSHVAEYEVSEKLAGSPRLSRIFHGYPVVHDRVYSLFANKPDAALSPAHCCGDGRTFIFDPLGRIFPCNNMVGERDLQIGSYFPELQWNNVARSGWERRSAESMSGVLKCKYALFCGGGSPYDSLHGACNISCKSCECADFGRTFVGFVVAAYYRLTGEGSSISRADAAAVPVTKGAAHSRPS